MKTIRILCNRLKNNRIKQRTTVTKIRKRNKTYCQTAMNLTKNSYLKPPTKNPQNHETEMKTRLKTLVPNPTTQQKTPTTLPKRMCDKKGGCTQSFCLKSSSPSEKVYIFLKQNTSSELRISLYNLY